MAETTDKEEIKGSGIENKNSFWRGGRGTFWALLLVVLILVALASGFFILAGSSQMENPTPIADNAVQNEVSVSPSLF